MPGKRGVIFDLDGVLLLSSEAHAEAYRRVLAPLGVEEIGYADIAGMRTEEVMWGLLRRSGKTVSDAKVRELVDEKRRLAAETLSRNPPIAPGCREVLERLAERFKLGLASSGSGPNVELFLNRSRTTHLFQAVLTGDDIQLSKPDPEIYLKALDRLGLRPEAAVVVEDAVQGVRAARAARITVIGMAGGVSREVLEQAGAGQVVSSLRELPSCLGL